MHTLGGEDRRATDRRSKPTRPVIVFIDDNSDTCECFALALEAEGYHVLTAENGEEGIELVKARRPDAVISNLHMPRRDGWDVCEFMRSNAPTRRTPLVLFTGALRPDGSNRSRAILLRARFVLKPCEPSALARLVGDLLHDRADHAAQDDR